MRNEPLVKREPKYWSESARLRDPKYTNEPPSLREPSQRSESPIKRAPDRPSVINLRERYGKTPIISSIP